MPKIFGIAGIIILSVAIWIKNERAQNGLFIVGGFALLIYSVNVGDSIFMALQGIFIVSAAIELIKNPKKKPANPNAPNPDEFYDREP